MDDLDIEESDVLFLTGVFINSNSTIDDMFFAELNQNNTKTDKIVYSQFPKKFYNVDSWPSKLNICCWACHTKIEEKPYPIPINMQYSGKQTIFGVEGVVCSFPCMARYINESPSNTRWEKTRFMFNLFEVFFGKKVCQIPAAPSPLDQHKYGGNLSENEYRHRIQTIMETLLSD